MTRLSPSIFTNLDTFYARSAGYVAYATPTDMFSLRNPLNSGKILIPRIQSMLVGSTAAALMKFFWYRRSVLNTLGTPTDLAALKYDSQGNNPVGVARIYGAAPTINDAAAIINQFTLSSVVLTAAPANFNTSGGSYGWAFNEQDFPCPLLIRPGEELAMNLAGAALPGGFTADCQVSWMEINA